MDVAAAAALALAGDAICQLWVEGADAMEPRRAFAMLSFGAAYQGVLCHFVYPLYAPLSRLCLRGAGLPLSTLAVGLGCSAIDNAIHSPFFYLPTFYLWVDTMQGSTAAEAWRHLRAEWAEVMRTCVVIWVPLQLLNFTLVPPARRVVFMNSCMLGWNVILDYMSHRAESVCPSSSPAGAAPALFTATARVCLRMQEAGKDCAR